MDDIDELNNRINDLQDQLDTVTEERDAAVRELEELKEIADSARDYVQEAAKMLDKADI